jgi:1-acyl-sn-glycerol-3-phosphate acyltransferase
MSSSKEQGLQISSTGGLGRWLIRLLFALTFRKIRLLHAGDWNGGGPRLFTVSHPVSFLDALILATPFEQPVRCLVPKNLVRGPLAGFLARSAGIILWDDASPSTEATWQEAIDALASGETVAVFADQSPVTPAAPGALVSTAVTLVQKAEAQMPGQQVAVHPVYLDLPVSPRSRELVIYVGSPLARRAARDSQGTVPPLAAALASSLQENAFQLRPPDVKYFLADLEGVLRAGLQEDWASRQNWKQDIEGFALSRLVTEWVQQMNYLDPGRLIALHELLDDYRGLRQRCALHRLEIETTDSTMQSGTRRATLWLETLVGLPIALYGRVNNALAVAVLFLAGSFRKNNPRSRNVEWTIRGIVLLVCYITQIWLVAHWWGRATAGYYAPALPITGAYLWRYVLLTRHRARLLFISLLLPFSKSKAQRLRGTFLKQLDQALAAYREEANAT